MLLALTLLSVLAASPSNPRELATEEIRLALSDPAEADQAVAHLGRVLARLERKEPALARALAREIAWNLRDKRELPAWKDKAFSLDLDAVRRRVIDYEAFKQDVFISSAVFPKRYFGYFDEAWDTGDYERTLRRVVRTAVAEINTYQADRKSPIRITDLEVAVTFIAEGGAILLRENQHQLGEIHPVYGVGLDDIAIGFSKHRALVHRLDEALGTNLQRVVVTLNGVPQFLRHMSFEEAILGTAVMWVYEKELCAAKLLAEGRTPLQVRSLDEQFILGSLVYNSGLVFSEERLGMIRTFRTGDYLAQVSQASAKKRWALPVAGVQASRTLLSGGDAYPDQPTSWSAVYHVLQRYGGYVALKRFTDAFDDRDSWNGSSSPVLPRP